MKPVLAGKVERLVQGLTGNRGDIGRCVVTARVDCQLVQSIGGRPVEGGPYVIVRGIGGVEHKVFDLIIGDQDLAAYA